MKRFDLILTFVFAMVTCVVWAQPAGDIPQEPGKCYAKCMIPDQYETVTQEIQTRAASRRVEVVGAQFETVTEQVLEKEAATTLSIVPAQYETMTEQVLAGIGAPSLAVIPAKYETLTEQVLSKEASTSLSITPAQFETVTEQVLTKEASTRIEVIPAVYETVTEQVLAKEAYTVMRAVPAVYETVTEQVLVKEASTQLSVVPAEYETVTEQVLVKEASTQLSVVPAVFETVSEQVMTKAASTRIERVPAKYETQTEQIEVAPSSTKWVKKKADRNCLSADPNDCLVWCLVETPAQYRTITKQVRVGCDEGWTDNGDDCTRTIDVPAEYTTRSYQKLVTPATTTSVEVPAVYETRTYQKPVREASSTSVEVPAVYETRSYQKLVSPATTTTEEVPAVYETRSYQKLVSPATTNVVEIPAEYTTRSYQKLVSPAAATSTEVPAVYTTRSYQKLVSPATTNVIPCGKKTILKNINFESGSAVLKQSSYTEISRLEKMLKDDPAITARLVGHTDSQGSDASNMTLSRNRAKAVYDVLVESGIAASRLSYDGLGESEPIADNNTASGRAQNRRTEFITFGGAEGPSDCNQYTTRSYQKLVSDATASSSEVAAQYSTRSYQKLASPAAVNVIDVPAQNTTISKRQLVKAGGFSEWREVVCSGDVTSDLVRQVQKALAAKGYDPGPADNSMGPKTKDALMKYQKDNGLPSGQLDFETLKSLGINR